MQYCGACFAEFNIAEPVCPYCGKAAEELSLRSYQRKLLHALDHPLAEVRMRAIIALGLRGEPFSTEALVDCALRHPTDIVEGLEIVRSLARLQAGTDGKKALERLASCHSAHAVRIACLRELERG